MAVALEIRRDLFSPVELRSRARRERNPRTATRMLAIANALEGLTRAEAARLAGIERQALRDAVMRYNQEGVEGLRDRPKPGRPPTLTDGEQALLRAKILQKPGPQDGCREWTLPALCRWIEARFNKRLHPASLSRIVRALDLSRQKTRPMHPQADPKAQAAFVNGGLAQAIAQAAQAHPDRKIALWFMDEARVGQKGRTGFRWWVRGERPRGLCDRRFEWTYLYGAVRPATGEDFALVLPAVSMRAMSTFLTEFAATIPDDTHVVMVLDQAGWHSSRRLCVPETITAVPLPAYAPELNPVERVWLYLREQYLSHRVLEGYDEIVTACCEAWNSLTAERLRSLCNHPWIAKVSS